VPGDLGGFMSGAHRGGTLAHGNSSCKEKKIEGGG